jgi:hypothetical protein
MRGTEDGQLLESPRPELLRAVTGLEPVRGGRDVLLEPAGVRSTQRLALSDFGGGIAVFTWPAELKPQAMHLYSGGRPRRLLEAAAAGGWEVDMRPHLGFRNADWRQRLYTNPTIAVEEYVARWSGADGRRIGAHKPDTLRSGLWPWLLARGHASERDTPELEPFLRRLGRRDAHLRPALRLLRR